MLVFVDESGDTGLKNIAGSSRYFVITLVIFEIEEDADDISRRIDLLRQELHLPLRYEFHFFKTKTAIRRAFLTAAGHGRFTYCALVVDKRKLSGPGYDSHDSFYQSVCAAAFIEALPWLHEANTQFDESGSREFRKSLASHLLCSINRGEDGFKRLKKVGTQVSKGNNLMQLADMICGAIARNYEDNAATEKNNGEFRQLIRAREQWVRQWPD